MGEFQVLNRIKAQQQERRQQMIDELKKAGEKNKVPPSYISEIISISKRTKAGIYPPIIFGTTEWCANYANKVYEQINAKYRIKGKPGIKTVDIIYWNIQGLGPEHHTTVRITFDDGSNFYIDADYAVPGSHIYSEKCLKVKHPDWTQVPIPGQK
jgi:hypothetical protein